MTTETSETAPTPCIAQAVFYMTLKGRTEPMCTEHAKRAQTHFGASVTGMVGA